MPIMMPDITPSADRRLAIIAGGGDFPFEVYQSSLLQGYQPCFFALRGFAGKQVRALHGTQLVDMLDPNDLIARLRAFAPSGIVLAGHVSRPDPILLLSAFSALRNQNELRQVLGEGDDHVLTRVIRLLEDHGFAVLGIDAVAPDLLCPQAVLTRKAPDEADIQAIGNGFALLDALSPFDCGQGMVCQGQRVLAVEGHEGTDRMIKRTAPPSRWFRFGPAETTPRILVKTAKLTQDRRADLPAVGPRTIRNCIKAGFSGLALGAGSVVMIDRAEMIRQADRAGLFIVGVSDGGIHG
jgi:DUF1009 family protein